MAAKPRITLRLAPSTLHALAYIAARDGRTPAEVARMMVGAEVQATLAARGLVADQQDHWRAWLAEQAAKGARPESPDQGDYDRLATGIAAPAPHEPAAPAAATRAAVGPLSAVIAESGAVLQRLEARLASGKPRS